MSKYFEKPPVKKEVKVKEPIEIKVQVKDAEEEEEMKDYLALVKVRNALSKKRKSAKDKAFFKDNPGLEAQVLSLRQKKLNVSSDEHGKIKISADPAIIRQDLKELIQDPVKDIPEEKPEVKEEKQVVEPEPEIVLAPVPVKEKEPVALPEPLPGTPELVVLRGGRFF